MKKIQDLVNFDDINLLKRYISPYKEKFALIVILTIVCSFFEAVNIGMLVPLMQIINGQSNQGGVLVDILTKIFNFLGWQFDFSNILIILAIVFLIGQTLVYIKERMQVRISSLFASDIRKRLFYELVNTDMAYHFRQKTGDSINALLTESARSSQGIYSMTKIMSTISLITIYLIMLFYISFEITIIVLFIAIISFMFFNIYIHSAKKIGREIVDISDQWAGFVNERLGIIKLIKITSNEDQEYHNFSKISDATFIAVFKHTMISKKVEILFQTILFIIAVSVLLLSEVFIHIQLPLLIVFLFILVRLTEPLRLINTIRHELTSVIPSLKRIDALMTNAKKSKTMKNGTMPFEGLKYDLKFDRVNFSYENNNNVLKNIQFNLLKNEMVAFVGVSGGGKSTLIDLILRIIEPTNGKILIDDTDLGSFEIKSYHAKIGMVSQDTLITNDSVLNNICYGIEKIDPDAAIEAAKIAYAHDFISDLPEGYATLLGDRGIRLSGGQKQRIAIARAIYRNPEILIFDEATSALDSESERKIQEAILNLRHKYTIILVAHRLSTSKEADRLFVIERGEIVEQGTHEELLAKNARYALYYNMQQGASP